MEPVANTSVVESELRRALNSSRTVPGNSVLLLRAAPEWRGDDTFTMEVDAGQVTVTVAKCRTVLAVLDAIGTSRDDGSYLVVLTPCETSEVGESVLARAMQPEIKPINRWDLVQDAFGARRLDPALTRSENRWVAEALLSAQPAGGWRRLAGPVLTRATALNRLTATRLGIRDANDSAVDAAALLEWTTDESAVASFLQLRDAERIGLVNWLAQSVGPVADVVFAMDAPGKVPDAVPFGLAIAALYDGASEPGAQVHGDALVARVRATERYLGGRSLDIRVLQAFGVAAESLVVRWTENGHAPQAAALCERAESILSQLADGPPGNLGLVGSSRVLEAGLDARLAAFAGALADALGDTAPTPQTATLARVQDALRLVGEHARKRDRGDEISAAQAAVRLARWLAAPDEPMATLHDAATSMLRSWAWADRALMAISRPDTSRVPRLAEAYAKLWDRARARRARLDQAFARKLATWTEGSSATDGLLLVENLMDRIARPIAPQRPPVVVVLDGMTAAIGCELAEELTGRGGWLEAGRRPDGREPALAIIPSVTSISRTSLLTGGLRIGGQAEERAGFAAFWGRRKSRLFHKADLTPGPGQSLATEVRDAIADPETVVGVVLNVIDDTLDKSKPGGPAHWTVENVTYLRPVLEEARRGGRSVILTADHGHVLEWGHSLDGGRPASSARSDSARYRIGEPEAGEIVIRGSRVLTAGAEVVAAVDETIHYTPKKAGYHGGASPAEVVIPAITLLPSESLLPPGWFAYDAAGHAPAWWDPPASTGHFPDLPTAQSTGVGGATRNGGSRRSSRLAAGPDDSGALFGIAEAAGLAPVAEPATTDGAVKAGATSLGVRIVASPRMSVQRQFLRRAPDDASIAALIDGMAQAGGRLTITEAASIAGESPVRMSGYLAQVTRLLNVDGYPVLQTTDGGRTVELNVPLLRQQFLGD